MNGMLATILNPEQQRDLVEALTVAVDDLVERVIPNRDEEYSPADVRRAENKLDRYVALISLIQKETHA